MPESRIADKSMAPERNDTRTWSNTDKYPTAIIELINTNMWTQTISEKNAS